MTALLADSAVVWVGRSLREGFFMFWETLWPLVLGFGLSGAVQAFVRKDQMERKLGDHRPASIVRASGYGMVSSSCSYAATAMAKSLFQKGADFVTAMVFMFASTNLVVELGIVLVVMMGWEFAAAEFTGGPIMILLVVLGGRWLLRSRLTDPLRERLRTESGIRGAHMTEHDHPHPTETAGVRSAAGWSDAAGYAFADFTMLRRELVIGYGVAGFLAVLVPHSAWNAVFLHGHGFWTSLENVIVGPLIALLAFVCSIGNVPLAAALWSGGISFGGVISFIYGDLITLPLLLIYRKYYGTKITLRLLALFWAVMSLAGLAVEGLFGATGLIPVRRATVMIPTSFQWNYTTYLNAVFLVVAAALYWLYRNRERLGGGSGYAVDPVCGMQVRTSDAPARTTHEHTTYYFCCDRCRERFVAAPERFSTQDHGQAHQGHEMHESATVDMGPTRRGSGRSD